MTLKQFIKKYKAEIDECIKAYCPNCKLNNDERESWILNDEGLYNWARSEGVKI